MFGFLDKSDASQSNIFRSLLLETHFLIHPAVSEPYGIALCEANAYGVPVMGTDVEGLKTIVRNGRNGYLYDSRHFVPEAARQIRHLINDPGGSYEDLCRSSVEEFQQRLNWQSGVREVRRILEAYLQQRPVNSVIH
jgi:glycosyltransferase involved in cell wall biosynthesis